MSNQPSHCQCRGLSFVSVLQAFYCSTGQLFFGLAFVALIGVGCRTSDEVVSTQIDDQTAMSLKLLTEAYDQRLSSIRQFYARGVIEIRWQDEDGDHFEQGNVDLWVERPEHASLRVEKLGEVYLWAGQNEQLAWVFDMTSSEPTLAIHDRAEVDSQTAPSMSLMTLLGLTRLGDALAHQSAQAGMESTVTQTPQGLWQVRISDGGGAQEWFIEPQSYEPRSMLVLNDKGQELARVEYDPSAFESVATPGLSSLAAPRIPGRVRLTLSGQAKLGEPSSEQARITLRLVNPDADVQSEPMDRVFDLERLTKALQPVEIIRLRGSNWLGGGLLDTSGPSTNQSELSQPGSEVPSQ